MIRKLIILCTLLPMLSGAGLFAAADATKPAPSKVSVVFDHPENFFDIKDSFVPTDKGQEAILDDIKRFVTDTASSYLAPGQAIEIKFTEIDLAGDFEPQHRFELMDVRIVKDIYPPRFDVEYKLTGADGKVLGEGKEKLRDLGFMVRLSLFTNDPLHYEKDLLRDWLHKACRPEKPASK